MSWFDFWWAFLAAGVVIIAPGAAVLSALRLSWGDRLVFAPVASAALVAVLGVGYAAVGLRFSALSFLVGSAVIAAGAYALRHFWLYRWLPADEDVWRPSEWVALVAGLAVGFLGWLWHFVHHLTVPNAVAKIYDAPWHLSIVRHILDSGNASTLTSGLVVPTDGTGFYPASFHGVVAMAAQISGADVATSVNATLLAIMAIAWPLSMIALTRTVLRRGAAVVIATAVMCVAFAAFPERFTVYGVLYANLFGYALLPALIAAAVQLFRPTTTLLSRVLLLGTAGVGAAVAQPNSVFTVWLFLMPFAIGLVYRAARDRLPQRIRWQPILVSTGFVVVMGLVWLVIEHSGFLRRTVNVDWAPWLPIHTAVLQVFNEGLMSRAPAYLTAAIVLAGAVIAWFRVRWLLGAYALACLCYVVNASTFFSAHVRLFRKYATGYWYHDSVRLAAAIILIAVPLAVLALVCAAEAIGKLTGGRGAAVIAGGLATVALAGAMVSPSLWRQGGELARFSPMHAAGQTATGERSPWMINSGKVAFMQAVRDRVGTAVVANDPDDGSAYGYGLVDLNVYFKAYVGNWMGTASRDQLLVIRGLNRMATAPEVCDAVRREHIQYVLQMARSGRQLGRVLDTDIDGRRGWYKGLELTPNTAGFKLVLSEPASGPTLYRLYEVTGC